MNYENFKIDASVLTNPEKTFFPEQGLTKKDVISYYYVMSDYILPYVKDRPFVMKRYPEGITKEGFYQKEIPSYAPKWLKSFPIYHEDGDKTVNYAVITDVRSLLWLVNQGSLELHCWLSRIDRVENPDIIIIDLDPETPATFQDVLTVSLLIRSALQQLGMDAWPKTSGATGMHLFLPIKPLYTFKETTQAVKALFKIILEVYPEKVTMEQLIKNRRGKVYLDYLQNSRGRTMAFPYSLRPFPEAPVSTPLLWSEVEEKNIVPKNFTLQNTWQRVQEYGDLLKGFFEHSYDIAPLLKLDTH